MPDIALAEGTIRYRERGTGEPLVFLHGYLMDGRLWDPVVSRLAGEFRCITPDLPAGAHRVPMAADADLTPRGFARLVDDFLEALGLDRVTLVGNDTGGAVAQIVAAEHPERLGRLVLTDCDCFDNFPPGPFRSLVAASRVPGLLRLALLPLRARAARRLPFAYGRLTKRALPDELISDWVDAFYSHPGVRRDCVKVTRSLDRAYTLDAAAKLGSFTRPALVAFAPEDRLFPFEHAQRLASVLPRARVERIEDSYTWVMLDQPDRTAQLIRDFVRSTPAGTEAAVPPPRPRADVAR